MQRAIVPALRRLGLMPAADDATTAANAAPDAVAAVAVEGLPEAAISEVPGEAAPAREADEEVQHQQQAGPAAEVAPAVEAPAVEAPAVEAPLAADADTGAMQVELGLHELLTAFIDLLPEEHMHDPVSWIQTSSTIRTLSRLILEGGEQTKLTEALLENGWKLAGDESTALSKAWEALSEKLSADIQTAGEAKPCAVIYDLRCRDHLGDVPSKHAE